MSAMQTIMALRPRRGLRFPMPASGHATPESPSTPAGDKIPKAEASEGNAASTPVKENRDVGPSDAATSVAGGTNNAVSVTTASPSDNVASSSGDRQDASTLHSTLPEQAPSANVNGAVNGASALGRSERVPRRVQCGRVERSARSRASFTESDRPAAFPGPAKSKEPHRLVAELFSASRVELGQLWNPFGAGWAAKKRLEKQLRRLAGGLREEVERREAAERELERLLWGVASQGGVDIELDGRVEEVTDWSLEGGKEGPCEPVDFSGDDGRAESLEPKGQGQEESTQSEIVRSFGGQKAELDPGTFKAQPGLSEEQSSIAAAKGVDPEGAVDVGAMQSDGRRSASSAQEAFASSKEESTAALNELQIGKLQYRLSLSGLNHMGTEPAESVGQGVSKFAEGERFLGGRELGTAFEQNGEANELRMKREEKETQEQTPLVDLATGNSEGARLDGREQLDQKEAGDLDKVVSSEGQPGGVKQVADQELEWASLQQAQAEASSASKEGRKVVKKRMRRKNGLREGVEQGGNSMESAAKQVARESGQKETTVAEGRRHLSVVADQLEEKLAAEIAQKRDAEAKLQEEVAQRLEAERKLEEEVAQRKETEGKLRDAEALLEKREQRLKEAAAEGKEKDRRLRETARQLEETDRQLVGVATQLAEKERRLLEAFAQMGEMERSAEEQIESKVAAAFTLIESFKMEKASLERERGEDHARAHHAERARERAEERAERAEGALEEANRELQEVRGILAKMERDWEAHLGGGLSEIRAAERLVDGSLAAGNKRSVSKKATKKAGMRAVIKLAIPTETPPAETTLEGLCDSPRSRARISTFRSSDSTESLTRLADSPQPISDHSEASEGASDRESTRHSGQRKTPTRTDPRAEEGKAENLDAKEGPSTT